LLQSVIVMDIKLFKKLWEVLSCKYTLLLCELTCTVIERIDAATGVNVIAHFRDKIYSTFLFHLSPFSPLFCYNVLFFLI